MKKFVLFATMFAVFTFALAACKCKKPEEGPVEEVGTTTVDDDVSSTSSTSGNG